MSVQGPLFWTSKSDFFAKHRKKRSWRFHKVHMIHSKKKLSNSTSGRKIGALRVIYTEGNHRGVEIKV